MPAVTKPSFTETNLISGWPNYQPRNGVKPRYFVLHTSEGAAGMDLVNYMRGAQVSYHYVVSNDATVYDLVDTDDASWSCMNANGYTINAVFGGSHAAWSKQDWLNNMGRALPIMAWLCASDLVQYNIPPVISLGPNYKPIASGVVDHRYFTQVVRDGNTHVDVGDGFPVAEFSALLNQFYSALKGNPVPPAFTYPSQADMIVQIWEQLLGPKAKGWPQLDGKSLVDAIAELGKKNG
jgi:hypothetical protein